MPGCGCASARSNSISALLEQMIDGLPAGADRSRDRNRFGRRLALVESFRGDVLASLRLDGGRVARCHLRDPSWFQWPLLEAAIENNIVADFPLCNKSIQLLVFGARSLKRRTIFEGLMRRPLTAAARSRRCHARRIGLERRPPGAPAAGRSLAIREVDAGSCNGCELEIHALNNAFYDLERSVCASSLAAPCRRLLVTGPVTKNMREALERTYRATPDPKWVVAVGDAARRRHVRRQLRGHRRSVASRAGRSAHPRLSADAEELLKGLIALLERASKNA